jgi:short subunit dehydrogenase-like uncharacterized protein
VSRPEGVAPAAPAAGSALLLYGATGYTGELIARRAVERGLRPILAGRSAPALATLAAELGLPHRVFALDDAAAVDAGLEGVAAVLHAAGPFSRTSRPMVDGCLRRRVHYLDITGEGVVFGALARRDAEARAAGVTLLPGVGFDVVPTDGLAAHLARRLPGATHLTLAFKAVGQPSRGTTLTALEGIHLGGMVRRGGKLTRVPAAWRTRDFDFGRGPVACMTIPWGDVWTAWHTTGIPDIEVYLAAPPALRAFSLASRFVGPLLGSGPVQRALAALVRSKLTGPDAAARARGLSLVYGEVEHADGRRAAARLTAPEGYAFTALAAVECAERVLAGQARAGFLTPSLAFGPDLSLSIPGVERIDLTLPDAAGPHPSGA